MVIAVLEEKKNTFLYQRVSNMEHLCNTQQTLLCMYTAETQIPGQINYHGKYKVGKKEKSINWGWKEWQNSDLSLVKQLKNNDEEKI